MATLRALECEAQSCAFVLFFWILFVHSSYVTLLMMLATFGKTKAQSGGPNPA